MLTLFGLAVFLPASALAQQSQSQQASQSKPQTQSLAEAARKAREKKGEQKAKVFTNDNLPTKGTVNVVGSQPAQQAEGEAQQGEGQAQGQVEGQAQGQTQNPAADEQLWRGRFAEARKKLADAEKELDILQRELNLMNVQYYSDPQKTLNEELTRKSVNEHRAKIDAKQAEVNQLKQAIEDLERDLRAAGGPPGWSRP
jgi:hypothetical protein